MSNKKFDLNELFKESYEGKMGAMIDCHSFWDLIQVDKVSKWTVEQWLTKHVAENSAKNYKNAAEAYKIQNSKLAKIIK